MSATVRHRSGLALASLAAILTTCILLLSGPLPTANATESPYCGGWLAAQSTCYGPARTFNAVYGIGEQHAVCVGSTLGGNVTCTHGPGEGTYDALGGWQSAQPWIQNRGFSENLVHGIAFTP